MDEKEAVKWQKSFMMMHGNTKEAVDACKVAVEALKKQIAQHPEYESNEHEVCNAWFCPNCGRHYEGGEEYCYCSRCGQKIIHKGVWKCRG